MEVTLSPELEQLIEKKIATGRYRSAADVVREGLCLLEAADLAKADNAILSSLDELQEKLREGIESLDRGDYSSASAAEIIAEGRSRLRQQRNG